MLISPQGGMYQRSRSAHQTHHRILSLLLYMVKCTCGGVIQDDEPRCSTLCHRQRLGQEFLLHSRERRRRVTKQKATHYNSNIGNRRYSAGTVRYRVLRLSAPAA
jgi:hypothetical protein